MNKYKYLYYIFFLFGSVLSTAQNIDTPISIGWSFNKIENKFFLEGDNQYIHNDTLYVVLSDKVYTEIPSFTFSDFFYTNIDIYSKPDSISINDRPFIDVFWTHGRDGWTPYIKIKPVVNSSNTLSLLSSFTLSETKGSLSTVNSFSKVKSSLVFKSKSVLSSGKWVKLSFDKSGVYKIDNVLMGDIASKMGVSLSNIDPRDISIFGQKGGMLPELNSEYNSDDLSELSIKIIGESDGKFDSGDYILFYGDGSDGWNDTRKNDALHVNNIYDNLCYVFITIKNEHGQRIADLSKVSGTPVATYDYYSSNQVHEIDEYNLIESGQQWFGHKFEREPRKTISFNFPNRDVSKDLTIFTRTAAKPSTSSTLEVKANDMDLYSFRFNRSSRYMTAIQSKKIKLSQENIDISFNFTYGGEGTCLLDFVEVMAFSKLKVDNSQFKFYNSLAKTDGGISEYKISNTGNLKYVWNITDPLNPKNIVLSSSSSFKTFNEDSNSSEYYQIVANNDFYTPEIVGSIENQNLHGNSVVDYIIVTHKDFNNSANLLANFHRAEGMTVNVVDVDKIYNEFSCGRQDLVAIRQYVRMIYNRGGTPSKLKYLLMFGDASYDYKDRLPDNTNFVPAYESFGSVSKSTSFVSDDFFGFMDDDEGDNISGNDLLDVAIGRIPIASDEEGIGVVDKILGYNSYESLGDWRNKIQFLADDINKNIWEAQLMQDTEKLSSELSLRNSEYNHQKVYLGTYTMEKTSGGNTYPDAHIDFMQNVQNGNLVTNYFGHGSEVKWTGEGLFDIEDIEQFQNNKNLPLFITVTCEFSRYDNPELYTGGEKLLVYKDGGSIGLISTTREITVSFGSKINEVILGLLLPSKDEEHLTIGEVLRRTKNKFPSYSSRRTVSLLGDPALVLAYPKKKIFITKVNYEDVSTTDTIKSLMKVHISGEVRLNGRKDTNFNGVAFPLMYDKKVNMESLDNNNFGIKIPYWVQKNVIYKGKSSIVDGEFSLEFVLPKDINYAFGNGKLSIYAMSDDTDRANDASGDNSDIIVGGIDISADVDDEGPKMNMYVNNKYFNDGGITNSSPIVMIDLEDESGINTVGNGIGHDLKMIITSDDVNQEILLNEFYESEIDSYTKGKVSYQMLGLKPGSYTAEVIAWDVFNNSSKSKLHFRVSNDEDVVLDEIKNYPNPFTDKTTFSFSHNHPNEELTTNIEIYTISGLLVKTITHHNKYDGFVVNDIDWKGDSDGGSPLKTGTYIYRISTVTEDGTVSNQQVNKLMIFR